MDAPLQLKESLADRYDIKREIGAGGMATVYLAQDLRHDISRHGRYLELVANKDDYQLVVVPNWRAELEQRLAASRKR